jgi:dTDP-4-dehydrorhamnose 3,5-epimerase-like enzyme
MIQGLIIKDLHFVGENDRGTTYEFENSRRGVQTLGLRKAGSINGRHYHEGKSNTKNPEIFILMHGRMEVHARNLMTKEEMTTIIDSPKILEIHPMVWHEIKAITDIVFIELNSIKEHAADTVFGTEV